MPAILDIRSIRGIRPKSHRAAPWAAPWAARPGISGGDTAPPAVPRRPGRWAA
jgi:hypothetical protein